MNGKKIMSFNQLIPFIRMVGRSELYDELNFINKKKYFSPTTLVGRDSLYLKGVKATLITLGYNPLWVEGPFTILLEHYYYDKKDDLSLYEKNEFLKFYEAEDVRELTSFYDTLNITEEQQAYLDYQEYFDWGDEEPVKNKIDVDDISSKSKRVVQYDLDGKYLNIFNSIKEANKALKKPPHATSIGDCCRGIKKTAFNYIWKFYDDVKK